MREWRRNKIQSTIAALTAFQPAVEECSAIRARQIENISRHPTAQRHAEQARHQHDADAGAGFFRRKVFADDDGVARNDAALEQAEHRRDDITARPSRRRADRETARRLAEPIRASRCASRQCGRRSAPEPMRPKIPQAIIRQACRRRGRRHSRDRRSKRRYGPAASTSPRNSTLTLSQGAPAAY